MLFSLKKCLALEWSAALQLTVDTKESHQDLYQTPPESVKLIAFSSIRGQKNTKLEASIYSPRTPPLGHLASLTDECKTQGRYK